MPFVPVSGASDLTRFKQLSTRRSAGLRRERTLAYRTFSSPQLGGRRLVASKSIAESSPLQSPDHPPITVAVHQFKGGTKHSDLSRAVVLQAPPGLPPVTSAYGVIPTLSILPSSSMLPKLPEYSTQQRASSEEKNHGSLEDLPPCDFPTLKASDVERKEVSRLAQGRQHLHRLPEEHENLKEPFNGTFTTSSTTYNGHTGRSAITCSTINGYSGAHIPDNNTSAKLAAGTSKLTASGRVQGVSTVTNINANGSSYAVPCQRENGTTAHMIVDDGHFLDPGQWTVVDETKDHPGMRRDSGFFQPIKHLSGKPEFHLKAILFLPHRAFHFFHKLVIYSFLQTVIVPVIRIYINVYLPCI